MPAARWQAAFEVNNSHRAAVKRVFNIANDRVLYSREIELHLREAREIWNSEMWLLRVINNPIGENFSIR